MIHRGFLVHAYVDSRKDRIFLTGRLADGLSFAVSESRYRPSLLADRSELGRLKNLPGMPVFRVEEDAPASFDGKTELVRLRFARFADRARAAALLRDAFIASPDADGKPADAYLLERGIRGPLEISGECRKGRLVDLVFSDPDLAPLPADFRAPLRLVSVDIETDGKDGAIRAVGIAAAGAGPGDVAAAFGGAALVRVHAPPDAAGAQGPAGLYFHTTEAELLRASLEDLRRLDPDVLTGWNFLDFDFRRLDERCAALGIPFALGRAGEAAKYLPGEGRRSAAALVPGRQVVDALRAVRAGSEKYEDLTLETVARSVLGEGKLVSSSGEEKLAELDRLYREDPALFGSYCLRDAELVLRILEKTGLFRLAVERAALMGVSLDKAWTSVAGFERIYAFELLRRATAPPPAAGVEGRRVSGAAGGTVLEAEPGLFPNVAVFDFRSLYPTIIRTFNIDPLAYERAGASERPVVAPNGAAFDREEGILPRLIAEYFEARRAALAAGDDNGAYVYKILMNSFYGVLGTESCRYGRTELAGSITSFARKWLLFSRDWFQDRGLRVLYGDTDSLFVLSGLDDGTTSAEFASFAEGLAAELNRALAERIGGEYGVESRLQLRFEKPYRRFLIPPLRGQGEEGRGRAKGYAGYLLRADGGAEVEVVGMEAVRSDVTALARRFQVEALDLVFRGGGEGELLALTMDNARRLRSGELDGELVYRKRLSRPPEAYTAATPPQVKAARALGWTGRRGTVEYLWTSSGAEPRTARSSPLDYDHYLEAQLFPVARSIAAAARWDTAPYSLNERDRRALAEGQMDLFFP